MGKLDPYPTKSCSAVSSYKGPKDYNTSLYNLAYSYKEPKDYNTSLYNKYLDMWIKGEVSASKGRYKPQTRKHKLHRYPSSQKSTKITHVKENLIKGCERG